MQLKPSRQIFCLLLLLSACTGSSELGPPATLEVVDGADQTASVGTDLPVPPAVKVMDDRGNPLPGTVIVFTVQAGNGSVIGGTVTADSAGIARVGTWTLGTAVGEQTLLAQVKSLAVQTEIVATAIPGATASISGVGPLHYVALTGTAVSPSPTVQVTDIYGNPQSGAVVTFTVTQGGGTVSGATVTTGVNGRATVGTWTLGITAGINRLQARIPTGASFTFDAQGLGSPPTQLVAVSPLTQTGPLAFQVEKTPRVMVKDAAGQILPNIPVIFELLGGGDATISGASAVSGADGIAALGDWKLGAVTTLSTVQVTIPGFPGPTALFQATGIAKPFTIDLRLLTSMTANQRDAFVTAALSWMRIITAALPPQPIFPGPQAGECGTGTPGFSGTVPNMIIWAQVVPIDGAGGILASAGPCIVRSASRLTAIGSMRFDAADLTNLDVTGRMVDVVRHEMGHVLGFGTNWVEKGLVSGVGTADPIYIGAAALALWPTFTMNYAGTPIPLETTGGAGTRDAHWRKSVFGPELMTGFIEPAGSVMPLSKLTIGVLQDLGFSVDYSVADPYRGNLLDHWAGVLAGAATVLNEAIEPARWGVGPDGKLTRVIRP